MQLTLQVLDPKYSQLHHSPASVDFEIYIQTQGPGQTRDVKGNIRGDMPIAG